MKMPSCFFLFSLFLLNTNVSYAMNLNEYLALPANPMNITVALDKEKISKKILAKVGGTLILKTASGDSFELTLPPHSLPQDTEITLQKIKTIKHANISSSTRYLSVEIFPDGIELNVPATLLFKPKNDFPIASLTPFSSQASGNETHLTTLTGNQTAKEIKVGLLHFSNYTIADDPTLDEIIDQGLSEMEYLRIESWLAREILKEKRTGVSSSATLNKAIEDVFKTIVLPSILGVNSCASGNNALSNYLTWQRQTTLLGDDPSKYYPTGFSTNFISIIEETTKQCMKLAEIACYQNHHPVKAMEYTFKLERKVALLGSEDLVTKLIDFRNKCLKFKFFMESEIWVGENRADSNGVTVKSEFDFTLSPLDENPVVGSINVESSYLSLSDLTCSQKSLQTKPSKIVMENFLFKNRVETPTLTIQLSQMTPISVANYRCVDTSGTSFDLSLPPQGAGSYWGGLFMATHGPTGLKEFDMKTGIFNTKGWDVHYDKKYATKEYTQSVQGSINEATTLIIYHTPDPL